MGRRSRTQNAVYTTFSCRGQLHYMDGLRTFKRETRLSFIGGKFARSYLRTNCNNRCLLIEPTGDRSVSLKTIPARGTSHFVLVASCAGNFALRARCKSRGELRSMYGTDAASRPYWNGKINTASLPIKNWSPCSESLEEVVSWKTAEPFFFHRRRK